MTNLSEIIDTGTRQTTLTGESRFMVFFLCLLMLMPWDLLTPHAMASTPAIAQESSAPQRQVAPQESSAPVESETPSPQAPGTPGVLSPDSTAYLDAEVLVREPLSGGYDETADTIPTEVVDESSPYLLKHKKEFNPSPTRAVWLSALFPGLGQVYNRRYWKLPIVVGAFMGLAYGTSWNNGQLQDYSQAYRDLMDSDPNTKSYMNFFPPTTKEEDLDKTWLTNVMRSRRDFYRRNRDLCIICVVGMYLLCMVDAYVDASLAHFDISPDLAIDWSPTMILNPTSRKVNVGLNWALTF